MGEKVYVEEVPDVPAGEFYAKIVKYEPYEGKYDPATRIFFVIKVGDRAVGPINGIFPKRATVANKTGKMLFGALGECKVDKVYDLDSLVEKRCWVEVVRVVTDDGPMSRVKRVIYPAPGSAAVQDGARQSPQNSANGFPPSDPDQPLKDMPF